MCSSTDSACTAPCDPAFDCFVTVKCAQDEAVVALQEEIADAQEQEAELKEKIDSAGRHEQVCTFSFNFNFNSSRTCRVGMHTLCFGCTKY
jgi:hypothetical protein